MIVQKPKGILQETKELLQARQAAGAFYGRMQVNLCRSRG